ncbi:hypothetical protein [Rahnella perminowiae]|nr:hypothetical protein [Rahnella perminowiae]
MSSEFEPDDEADGLDEEMERLLLQTPAGRQMLEKSKSKSEE